MLKGLGGDMASTLVVKPWVHVEFCYKSRKSVVTNKIVANQDNFDGEFNAAVAA